MSSCLGSVFLIACLISVAFVEADDKIEDRTLDTKTDLDTSATSAKLLNLGGLFGQQNPSYGYGSGSTYPNNYRPTIYRPNVYPSTGSYYPTTGGNYYPTTGGSYYPSTGGSYYPTTGGNYYPSTGSYYPTTGTYPSTGWTGSQYPNTGSGYYPSTGSGYYPNTGTNILGGSGYGGYGGYGGNGGLHQYSGYVNPDYTGQRNRGYGYQAGTDRYGISQRDRGYGYQAGADRYGNPQRDRDYGYGGDYGGFSRDRDRDHTRGAYQNGYRGYD